MNDSCAYDAEWHIAERISAAGSDFPAPQKPCDRGRGGGALEHAPDGAEFVAFQNWKLRLSWSRKGNGSLAL